MQPISHLVGYLKCHKFLYTQVYEVYLQNHLQDLYHLLQGNYQICSSGFDSRLSWSINTDLSTVWFVAIHHHFSLYNTVSQPAGRHTLRTRRSFVSSLLYRQRNSVTGVLQRSSTAQHSIVPSVHIHTPFYRHSRITFYKLLMYFFFPISL